MKVIITIPAYNEEKHIGYVLEDIKKIMSNTKYNYQILVVDDGSTDNTKEIAKKAGAIVFSHITNRGLAQTFKTEMEKCLELKADIIVHTDADAQYCSEPIPLMIKKIEEGDHLVIGTRFSKGGKYIGSFMNRMGNIIFAKVFSNILKRKITDTTTGFRAFTPEVAKISLQIINNFTYVQEQLIRVVREGMNISEVPIITRPTTRKSRLFKNPLEYAVRAWINIFRIYRDYDPLKFFGRIAILLLFIGFIIGVWLFYLFITRGYTGHIGLIILTVLLVMVGLQIGLFGFLADMLKK